MLDKLRTLGIEIEMGEVMEIARGGALARPHLARALVNGGHVADMDEAFGEYIGDNGPAYAPKVELSPEEAVALVTELGGLPILAHPGASRGRVDARLGEIRDAGLAGIEVWHPRHSPADVAHYARLTEKLGLLKSGGSDFHGEGQTDAALGEPSVPYPGFETLREAHAGSHGRNVAVPGC
jgi:predicted metal-dependent phosphoesterase TrpH